MKFLVMLLGFAFVAATAAYASAPDLVTNEAVFWIDASTLEQSAGTQIDSWPDVRGADVHFELDAETKKFNYTVVRDGNGVKLVPGGLVIIIL